MPESSVTLLDYLRHGEPVGGSRFRGNGVDDPLSERGWEQMRTTSAALSGWDRVISSPMQRCLAFARWLCEERGLPLEVIEDLREVGFGSWEGVQRDILRQQRPAEYEAFYADPVKRRPTGAEPIEAFAARISAVYDDLVRRHAGQRLLVVCHAGVIRATLGHVVRMPALNWYRTEVDNAAVSRFVHDRLGARLVTHNWRPSL